MVVRAVCKLLRATIENMRGMRGRVAGMRHDSSSDRCRVGYG
ncbi:hypothetical protein COLINT_02834 [Collinsella intestinalis DSM 13280]|uniref:Uncharacterized protein n=1 Tax=Collinsella intestinalis DSM 13280 TaxID=521003 RepID=C4F9V0_9ACTN|nr:hypothetical protein COLINT_02834 [Collinsella intestinalis DSM 13280]